MQYTIRHVIRPILAVAAIAMSFTSCIDEDLSECGKDYKANYSVQLRTNVTTEIETELTTDVEKQFGVDLSSTLENIFTDWARDLDLSFYTDDNRLAQHDLHRMDASTASYTIYLPVRRYQNLALANTAQDQAVDIDGLDNQHTLCLRQLEGDTLQSHSIGLFSARQQMEIEDRDQEFNVDLYMQNCTACLVLDPGNVALAEVRGCITGLASSFNVNDSIYHFDKSAPIRANELRNQTGKLIGLYATGFPSHNTADEVTADPRMSKMLAPQRATSLDPDDNTGATTGDDNSKPALWQIKVYVRLANGKTTESVLSMSDPLKAGQLRIIKAAIRDDGSISSSSQNVGVSVKLDWKPGGEHEIEM